MSEDISISEQDQREVEALKEQEAMNRVDWVFTQVRDYRDGHTRSIRCPYCHSDNKPGADLCCDKMVLAFAVAVRRMESDEQMEHAERIAERVR